nr:ribonuclease H-like domain-containing protein [Tanacetum cinerariifolium]
MDELPCSTQYFEANNLSRSEFIVTLLLEFIEITVVVKLLSLSLSTLKILNGDSPVPTRIVKGVSQPVAPTTAEQRLARKNELKACGTLLMALPDKHQLKFNSHKDAKILMEAIEKRFGLDQIHDRLQKLVSQLEIHGVSLSQEDVKLKFLRSLPSEWKIHTFILRNKADLEKQNLDDLFNSLKIYETEVKQSSSPGTATQNLAFVSSTSTDSTTDSVSAAASAFADCINLGANGPTSMGFDMSKVECYNCHRKGHFAREYRSPMDPRKPDKAEPQRRIIPPIETTFQAATSVPASPKFNSSGKRRNKKACFVCKSVDHLIKYYDYYTKTMAQPIPRNYAYRGHHKQCALLTHSKPQKHRVPTAVLTQSKPFSNTAVRPVSAALPKIIMTRTGNAHPVVTKFKSPIRRHITRSPSSRTSNSPPRVTTVQAPVVSAVQGKQGTWGNPQQALKDKGVIDSGCSRHMAGNMSYLSDFEELNG